MTNQNEGLSHVAIDDRSGKLGAGGTATCEVEPPMPRAGAWLRNQNRILNNTELSNSTVASTASRAYLDYNGDGIAEKTGWIAPEDGLLALDGNGNGVIDGLGELFGTAELDGFSELAGQDKNLDGAIDAQDAVWDKLKVWRDANGDGVSQAGELQGLDSLGIVSIGLATTPGRTPDGDNIVGATGEYLWRGADGTLSYRPIADLEFAVNFALTDGNPVRPLGQAPELDGEVFGLPWLRGYGIKGRAGIRDRKYLTQPKTRRWRNGDLRGQAANTPRWRMAA